MAVNPLSHRPDDPSSALLRRGQPPSKAERAYEALRDRIVMLRIHPGAPLLEEQLTSDLGVGRTPLREAFKRLELERLVVTYPRRGTFATDINITDLTHISEVRQELEPVGAALAARRATNHDRDLLTSLADQLESNCQRGLGPHALLRLDLRVHRSIYAATHNPYLEETLLLYDNLATRIWCMFIGELVGVAGHVEEHIPLIRSLVAGDSKQAASAAHDHVQRFEQAVRSLLSGRHAARNWAR